MVRAAASLVLERVLQLTNMVLRLLQQRPQRFGHIGQAQVVGLRHPLPIPVELALFEFDVSFESGRAIGDIGNVGHLHRRRAAEKIDLLSKYFRVLQFLTQMVRKLFGDRVEFGAFYRRDVLDVLNDRLVLAA